MRLRTGKLSADDRSAQHGILTTSFSLLVLTLCSRFLSMLREIILASRIGMNAYTDAFNISQSAISFSTSVIGATCLSLVPLLVDASREGNRRRDEVFTSIFNVYMLVCLVFAIVLTVFSSDICRMLGPGMSEESQELAASLLRIGFIKINCVTATSLFSYYLQSRSVFSAASTAALLGNATVVILLFFNTQATIYDYTVYSVIGLVVQVIVPLPYLFQVGYRPRMLRLFENKAMRVLLVASVPLMASMLFMEIQTLVGRAIGTSLGEGTASSLDYANKIIQLLYASITMSLNSVLYTKLASSASEHDDSKSLRYLLAGGRNQILFLIPLTLLLVFLGKPLIALVFQRGAFTAENTEAVYLVLLGYLIGAWPYVFSDLCSKYFVSLKQYSVINKVNAVGYCVSLLIVFPAAQAFGAPGISMSFAMAQIVILVGYCVSLSKRQGKSEIRSFLRGVSSPKDLVPGCVLLVFLLVLDVVTGGVSPVLALVISVASVGAYALLVYLLRVRVGFRGIS